MNEFDIFGLLLLVLTFLCFVLLWYLYISKDERAEREYQVYMKLMHIVKEYNKLYKETQDLIKLNEQDVYNITNNIKNK